MFLIRTSKLLLLSIMEDFVVTSFKNIIFMEDIGFNSNIHHIYS